jgi:hypothetical protein
MQSRLGYESEWRVIMRTLEATERQQTFGSTSTPLRQAGPLAVQALRQRLAPRVAAPPSLADHGCHKCRMWE